MSTGCYSHAWYALRRTLVPWRFDELLEDLVESAVRFGIDEVIVKLDVEEFFHGHPSLEWARAYQPRLLKVREELTRRNIVYSLNPWVTAGQCDRGRNDLERLPGLEPVVGHDGIRARHCACFLSEAWRRHIAALWRLYAATEPQVLWVEDDIRTFNHEPVRYGCFCDRHLAEFGKRIGRPVTRGELVAAILQPGEPHPWRAEYLDMQCDIMIETAGFLARTVHEVSPATSLGLMSSGPRLHCLEGRDWRRFAAALADGRPLYSRPPMSNYNEESLRGLYYSQDSIKLTRHVLPPETVELTEVENVPFTRFSKSVAFSFLEIALSFAYGADGVTLNLFDHVGTPMADEAEFGWMLAERKPFLTALSRATLPAGAFHGVRLFHEPAASKFKRLAAGAGYGDLCEDGYNLMQALESHGIATTFTASEVSALSGETARALDDDALTGLLAKGLFLDGPAARILVERGFGLEIGLAEVAAPCHRRDLSGPVAAEEIHDPEFGGGARKYLTVTLPTLWSDGRFCRLKPRPGARSVADFVDPDTVRVMPAMVAFVNSRGGRVVTHALDYQSAFGVSYCHPFRRDQLHHVVKFLYGDRCPDILFQGDGAYALAWRKTAGNFTVLGCFNFNLDGWTRCRFTLAAPPEAGMPRPERLTEAGIWTGDDRLTVSPLPGGWRIDFAGPVDFRLPLVLRFAGNETTH